MQLGTFYTSNRNNFYFLIFFKNTDSEVFQQTDARIFALILPILGILAVRMIDIRTRHPKNLRKQTDGPSGIKKARTDTD